MANFYDDSDLNNWMSEPPGINKFNMDTPEKLVSESGQKVIQLYVGTYYWQTISGSERNHFLLKKGIQRVLEQEVIGDRIKITGLAIDQRIDIKEQLLNAESEVEKMGKKYFEKEIKKKLEEESEKIKLELDKLKAEQIKQKMNEIEQEHLKQIVESLKAPESRQQSEPPPQQGFLVINDVKLDDD